MTTYSINDLRPELKIMLDGEPYSVISCEFVKPTKGQKYARATIRRLLTGAIQEKTFKSTDSFQSADVIDMDLTYSYNNDEVWYFTNHKTYEQFAVNDPAIFDNAKWLVEGAEYIVTFFNGVPVAVRAAE